jgi:hypothetical protein
MSRARYVFFLIILFTLYTEYTTTTTITRPKRDHLLSASYDESYHSTQRQQHGLETTVTTIAENNGE